MTKLSIKGHPTRGKEVIEILEMLGAKNNNHDCARFSNRIYFINEDGEIESCNSKRHLDYIQLSLEEFLEKYPYKVGDLVKFNNVPFYKCEVDQMYWDDKTDNVTYIVKQLERIGYGRKMAISAKQLKPYKKETMEERKYADLRLDVDQDDKLATEATIDGGKITPPENYLIGKITQVDNGMLVEFVKKQPKFPKTYKECCDVLGLNTMDNDAQGYKGDLIIGFQELLIARDAYWKIAGEQMGLKEPWKPDWDSLDNKYDIYNYRGDIKYDYFTVIDRCLLVFPTEEIRDAFYENFKDLIENCKEFL